ncbi:MAG: hypothetical protein DRJ03_06975 [Chloroflexi bacterium]|nr:MAG: hypothetical protein DRJ03_06975 [Chloroflexota bacterium]
MSVAQKLKSVKRDGNFVALTYLSGEDTEITKRMTVDEFDRQLGMLKQFNLTHTFVSEEVEAGSDSGVAVGQLFELKKDILEEVNDKIGLLNNNYKSLKDFMATVQVHRDKFHENLQQEASASLNAVTAIMDRAVDVQASTTQQIADKETVLKGIISDIENRNEWTWEEARKTQNEVDRSKKDLAAFKGSLSEQFDVLFNDAEKLQSDFKLKFRKLEENQRVFIEEKSVETKKLLSGYRAALADKSEFLQKTKADEYKQSYLDNELTRRTEIEHERARSVVDGMQNLQSKIQQRAQLLESKIEEQSGYLDSVFDEIRGGVDGFSEEITTYVSELTESREILREELVQIEKDVALSQRRIVQVNKVFSYFASLMENSPERLNTMLQRMESFSTEWDDRYKFVMDFLEQGVLVDEADKPVKETLREVPVEEVSSVKKSLWKKFWE